MSGNNTDTSEETDEKTSLIDHLKGRKSAGKLDIEDDSDDEEAEPRPQPIRLRRRLKPVGQSVENDESSPSSFWSPIKALSESMTIVKTLLTLLFSNTSKLDKLILIIGAIFSCIHGIIFPFVAVLFGSMTNSFIQQSINGFANSTSSTYATKGLYNRTKELLNNTDDTPIDLPDSGISEKVGGIFDMINKIVLQTFTEEQALTKDEFLDLVDSTGKIFLWLAIVVFISSFLQVLCWEWVAANQKFNLREYVVKKILRQDMIWFGKHDIGELVAVIFSEVGNVREALGFNFSSILEYFAIILSTSLIAVFISWRLALVFLSPTPFMLLQTLTLGQKVGAASAEAHELWEDAEAISAEFLAKVDTVVAFGEEASSIETFRSKLKESMAELYKKYDLAAKGSAILVILLYGSYAAAFWYSCRLLMQGTISTGEVCTIFLSITMGTLAFMNIIKSVNIIGTAYESAKHLEAFGQPFPVIDCFCESGKVSNHPIQGGIEFLNVAFSYPGAEKVLNNLSFKIEPGKTVAILSSGGGEGKTTIANLLVRLYDPIAGKIKLDGINIKKLNLKNLRRHIGIALQKPQMNEQQVDENIRAGRAHLSLEDIKNVKKLADPTNALQDSNFSDAKFLPVYVRRKINIARSLANDPSVLILDESFSDLLPHEKELVRTSILAHRKGKTTIILTTDVLSTQDSVDQIYILKDGQILQHNIGSHADLIDGDGDYTRMHKSATTIKAQKRNMSYRVMGTTLQSLTQMVYITRKKPEGYFGLYDINPETKRWFVFGGIGSFIMGLGLAIFALFFVQIFGTFSKTGEELADDGVFWAGMLFVLAIIGALGNWLTTFYMSRAGLNTILSIRTRAFSAILRRPKSYYDDESRPVTSPAALGTKVMCSGPFIKHVFEFYLPEGLSVTVTLFSVACIVSSLVWQIGTIGFAIILPVQILLSVLQYKIQKSGREKSCRADDETSDLITKAVDMIELVQTLTMQEYYIQKYLTAVNPAIREAHKQAFVFAVIFGLSEVLFFAFFGLSFLYGSYLIDLDAIQPESLFKSFFSLSFCVVAFSKTVSLMPDFAKAVASLELINNLILEEYDFDPSLDAMNEQGQDATTLDGGIEFRRVYFNYNSKCQVFKGLDLTIKAGTSMAITGKPLFGGTTLLLLVLRLYDVESGEVLFNDEKDVRFLNLAQTRQNIGWVPQNISFFDGSVADNIKLGCKKPTSTKKLKQVLSTVMLLDEFEKELHTYKDDKYWNCLSRGKKILIAIARAILRDPKILLIDSPTCSLSDEDEMKILTVIKKIKMNRTCIIISNSPSTIALADKIAVIEEGRVLEQGTLEELVAQDGYYVNWLKKLT